MALIKCEECGNDVSDKAAACPKCGAPVVIAKAGPIGIGASSPTPEPRGWSGAEPIPQRPPKSPSKPINWWIWIPVGLVVSFFAFGFSVSGSPEAKEKQRQRDVITLCWDEQQRKSLDPGTQRFVAATCEKMEGDFATRFGHRP